MTRQCHVLNMIPACQKAVIYECKYAVQKQSTYAVDAVDEWVVAAVAHGEPVADEEDDVDVAVAAKQ